MDKRSFGVGVVTLALVTMGTVFGGGAAFADVDGYTPDEPKEPSLAGSSAAAVCIGDDPVIQYQVTLNDPDDVATSDVARLVLTDGTNSVSLALGTLSDDTLSGTVLWPGADTDGDGAADSWPGWLPSGDSWVATDGNYNWTRGDVTAYIEVNPTIEVALDYPSGGDCEGHGAGTTQQTTQQPTGETSGTGLAATGGTTGTLLAAGGIGGVLLVGGVLMARRRKNRT